MNFYKITKRIAITGSGYGNNPISDACITEINCPWIVVDCDSASLNAYVMSKTSAVDLTKAKVIYFESSCKYPRAKLADNTSIKRCLTPKKADAIITSLPNAGHRMSESFVFEINGEYGHGRIHDLQTMITRNVHQNISNQNNVYKLTLKEVQDIIVKMYPKLEGIKLMDKRSFGAISDDVFNMCNMIENSSIPVWLDDDVDKEINKLMEAPDDTVVESIREYLQSEDLEAVDLGLNMLSKYNVTKDACTIGLMILANRGRIVCTNASNQIGVSKMFSNLRLSKSGLAMFRNPQLGNYVENFLAVSDGKEPEEKSMFAVKRFIADEMNRYSKQCFSSCCESIGIKVPEIKIGEF